MVEEDKAIAELDRVSHYASFLAIVEIGLGSIIQGFKVPFGGQALSVNQGAVLVHATKNIEHKKISSLMMISTVVAVLKSLSPAGNKLGPMLSICMQGFLYSFGVAIFGSNIAGVVLGMTLLALWAFIQPFITLYIFFGHGLVEALDFYIQKMTRSLHLPQEYFFYALLAVVVIKVVVAVTVGILTYRQDGEKEFAAKKLPSWSKSLFKSLPSMTEKKSLRQILKLSFRDLTRPFFLFSFFFMVIFFSFSQNEWSKVIWLSMRPLAIAFVFFFLCRAPWPHRLGEYLRQFSFFQPFFLVMDGTIEKVIEWQYEETEPKS